MPMLLRRKIRRGVSTRDVFEITLPKSWIDFHEIRPGDEVILLANNILVIIPDVKDEELFEKVRQFLKRV